LLFITQHLLDGPALAIKTGDPTALARRGSDFTLFD
jgi:hypothetical protein